MSALLGWLHNRWQLLIRVKLADRRSLHAISPAFQPRLERLEGRCLMAVDVVLEWNEVLLQANANDHSVANPEQGGPILTGRAMAIVSAAMYDAYNSIERIGEAYLVTAPRATKADSDAAVAQAAHDALVALYPSQKSLFDAELKATLARIRNGRPEDRGRAVGAFVARQILAARADDGTDSIGSEPYVANGLPGFHDVDSLHPGQGFYAPGAWNIDPFAVESVDQFEARRLDDGTPEGRAAFLQSQEYTDAFNELAALGSNGISSPTERTAEQTLIGIYWGYDGRPGLGTPPRLYNQIVREIAIQEGNTEAENVRLFALVNIAMADAGFTSWNNKYDDAFWRPILGLRGGEVDGNPETIGDADWAPLGAPASNPRPGETNFTPPFPAYTSGHATFGAAAFQILTRFYGRDDIQFSFVSDELNGVTLDASGEVRPLVERTFNSFTQAKLENAQSRIYLGIHWAFDRDEGIRSGDGVADFVFENVLETTRHRFPGSGDSHSERAIGSGRLASLTTEAVSGNEDSFVSQHAVAQDAAIANSQAAQRSAALQVGQSVSGIASEEPTAIAPRGRGRAAQMRDTVEQLGAEGVEHLVQGIHLARS